MPGQQMPHRAQRIVSRPPLLRDREIKHGADTLQAAPGGIRNREPRGLQRVGDPCRIDLVYPDRAKAEEYVFLERVDPMAGMAVSPARLERGMTERRRLLEAGDAPSSPTVS